MSIESRSIQYGSIFGQWHIEKLLGTGSGGKSAVFSIYRENNGWREYSALKVICLIEEQGTPEELSSQRRDEYSTAVREQRAQADHEVRLMDQLRGKTNIVDYQDHAFHSWHDDTGFGVDLLIRMEKLKDLRSRMRTAGQLPAREVLRIGRDICQALVICHDKKILHRDIKPENIFFNQDGDYKLGDFGISRILDNSQTMASTGIGTLPYLAPEQNSGRYDERVDIYSLGLVLYELANGNRLPFADSSYIREAHIRRRLSGEALPPIEGVSKSLSDVILAACAFNPEDRFQSARAMLTALDTVSRELGSDENPGSGAGAAANYNTMSANSRIETKKQKRPGTYDTVPGNVNTYSTLPGDVGSYSTVPGDPGTYSTVPAHSRTAKQSSQNSLHTTAGTDTGKGGGGRKLLPLLLVLGALIIGGGALLLLNREKTPEYTEPSEQLQASGESTGPADTLPPAQTDGQTVPPETEAVPPQTQPPQSAQTEPQPTQTEPQPAETEPQRSWNETVQIMERAGIIAAGGRHTVVLMPDGTAIAEGRRDHGQCNVEDWTDLIAVAAGDYYSLGLRSDGTVVAAGDNSKGQCNVEGWTDIVMIAAGDFHALGLRSDGTVVIVGNNNCGQADARKLNEYADGRKIVAIAGGYEHSAVLYSDGTVYAIGSNKQGQLNVSHWQDVVAVFAGANFTAALFSDGTMDVVGDSAYNLQAVGAWQDVMFLTCGDYYNVAVTRDGRLLATGLNSNGQINVTGWEDIIAISAGHAHTVAITSDGRILATGDNSYGQMKIRDHKYE